MEWKSLFRPHILARGYDYYLDDKVNITNKSDAGIEAEVEGSETYVVNIGVENETVDYMECDCPYAMDGNNCKHMAATLYQYFDDNEVADNDRNKEVCAGSLLQRNSEENKKIESLLERIPETEKHRLLVKILAENSELKNSLKLKYDFRIDAKQMLEFKNEIQVIVSEHSVRGFVDWSNAFDFCGSLESFLAKRVNVLIEKNYLLQAFELNNQVFRVIGTIDMDDSDGCSGMIAEKCYEYWLKIYQKANDVEKEKIKEFFFKYKEGTLLDYIEEYLFEFKENELASVEEITEAMSELDRIIATKADFNDCGYIYSVCGVVSVIEKRVEYMTKLGATKGEIDTFLKQNRQFSVVRNMEIDHAIEKEDFENAIDLLIESKKIDRNNKKLLENYSRKLIELYKDTGNIAGYIDELKYNLLNCAQTDAELFKKLKKNILDKEEWKELAEKIIDKNKGYNSVYALLNEEKRYDQMMDMLEEKHDIFVMDEYVKILSGNVPERVVQFYSTYVINEMERASDRKHYRFLVNYLKVMSFCSDGKESAKRISESWKTEYNRRAALMDELRKAGY